MGNKKFKSTCPLINKRKLINQKVIEGEVTAFGLLKYKNKEFILTGFYGGMIEVYDSLNLEKVAYNKNEDSTYVRYVGQLIDNYFTAACIENICIYIFYEGKNNYNSYNIKTVQKIFNINNYYNLKLLKAILFDWNLYRENNAYEMVKDKNEKIKNKNYKRNIHIGDELIISSDGGIFLFNKKKEEDKEEIKVDIDIDDLLEKWKKYPFEYKQNLTNFIYVYDMIQINSKYLAGTTDDCLFFVSMETYEIVTKFKVKVSIDCDSIMFMLNDDILCMGGDDSITLISIKNFEILSETKIKSKIKITEICILPDFNILIGMKDYKNNKEYFYQYKYKCSFNKSKKKMEHNIIKGTEKLLTKNDSNIMMRCLMKDRLVTILDLKIIQVWE
jgi:hypothetical protein